MLAPQAASSALAPLQCREIGAYGDEAALQAAEAALLGHMKLAGGQWQRFMEEVARDYDTDEFEEPSDRVLEGRNGTSEPG